MIFHRDTPALLPVSLINDAEEAALSVGYRATRAYLALTKTSSPIGAMPASDVGNCQTND